MKEKKLREPEKKKELAQTLKTFYVEARNMERIRSMYNKTIIRFGFFDIQNNQGLGKGYQPQPSASAASTLIILDITKTSSNNCL